MNRMQLFLSYARQDGSKADLLAHRIRQLGHEAWLDANLVGGQTWWDEILRRIRDCDAVLSVISPAYVRSEACISERGYALQLRKPILPVLVESMRPELLPADISRLQVIDYSTPGEDAAIQLAVGLLNLRPMDGLPAPLPSPPPMPMSYLSELNHRVNMKALSLDDQLALVVRLESALDSADEGVDRAFAMDLLHRLGERRDLYAEAERKIAQVIASSSSVEGSSVEAEPGVAPVGSSDILPSPTDVPSDDFVTWQATLVRRTMREREISIRLSDVEFFVKYEVTIIGYPAGTRIRIYGRVRRQERKSKSGLLLRDEFFAIEDGPVMRTLRIQANTKGVYSITKFRLSVDDEVLYEEDC